MAGLPDSDSPQSIFGMPVSEPQHLMPYGMGSIKPAIREDRESPTSSVNWELSFANHSFRSLGRAPRTSNKNPTFSHGLHATLPLGSLEIPSEVLRLGCRLPTNPTRPANKRLWLVLLPPVHRDSTLRFCTWSHELLVKILRLLTTPLANCRSRLQGPWASTPNELIAARIHETLLPRDCTLDIAAWQSRTRCLQTPSDVWCCFGLPTHFSMRPLQTR